MNALRRAVSVLDRAGHITQQPLVWAGFATALGLAGGRKGREAALRGVASYGLAAVVGNLVIKPLVRRPRPPEAGRGRIGPVTSSFPSGHAASDLAFVFGAAQALPALFPPLALASFSAHWSLVRTRGHYASDVVFGGALGIAAALAVRRLWRDDDAGDHADETAQPGHGTGATP